MALPNTPIDGPPPSPATDPAAAREAGMPISGLASPVSMGQPQPSGPDLSGVNALGQKLIQGCLALAQAMPLIAPDMDAVVGLLQNALGKVGTQAGMSGSMPPTGSIVTGAGAQFPGGGQGSGRPF